MTAFFTDWNNYVLLAVALISGGLLAWPNFRANGQKVSPAQATALINQRKAVVIDVRETGEFSSGHLPGAKHIPLAEVQSRLKELVPSIETPLIMVCQSGMRSTRACDIAGKLGFIEVFNLEGGMGGWQQAGLPVHKNTKVK
jgi:rhodanese-related sulfurtransferase